MGLSITSPQDAYVVRNTNVSWQGVTGQTAYELMYKLKSASGWNTLGIVYSGNTYASLSGICDRVESGGYSFSEIHYRVKVYTTTVNGTETTQGEWYSNACNLIFRPDTRATLKAKKGGYTVNIPLFEKSTLAAGKKLNTKVSESAVLCAPLVGTGHPLKSGVKANAGGTVLEAASDTASFAATGITANAYMTVSGSYYGYVVDTASATGYYTRYYKMGPEYYQFMGHYYYITGYYYVYNTALYYGSAQYSYSQIGAYNYYSGGKTNTKYYTYYGTGYYYYSDFSAGWLPVWTYFYYIQSSGYYYYYGSNNDSYNYSYFYNRGVNGSYSYSYYLAG